MPRTGTGILSGIALLLLATGIPSSMDGSPGGGHPGVKVPDVLPHGQALVETNERCVNHIPQFFRGSRAGLPRCTNCVSYVYQPFRCCKGRRMIEPEIAVYTFSSVRDARYGLLNASFKRMEVNSVWTYLRIMENNNPGASWMIPLSWAYSASPIRDLFVAGDGDAVLFQLDRYLVVVRIEEHLPEQIYQLEIAEQICALNENMCGHITGTNQ